MKSKAQDATAAGILNTLKPGMSTENGIPPTGGQADGVRQSPSRKDFIMKVIFPNPYGYQLPDQSRVVSLQKSFGFSDEYARFLLEQNGFSFDKLEDDSNHSGYLAASNEIAERHADLRVLYGFDSGDDYYDLEDHLQSFIFAKVFFPIGVDYGGSELVEILAGPLKGYIAGLDHEMYAGSSSIDEYVEEFELDGFHDMSPDEQAELLADEDFGLAWIFAPSMNEFTASCLHCDENFRGFVVESLDADDDD